MPNISCSSQDYFKSLLKRMCPDEETGCSARDLVMIESCRAENLLYSDIKYVMNRVINP